MGQYYRPVSLDTMEWAYSHNAKEKGETYGQGLKLMEHSYIGNALMNTVENLLKPGGRWYKHRIVWAGDYADGEDGTVTEENPEGENIFTKCADEKEIVEYDTSYPEEYPYIVNHDLKFCLDKRMVKGREDAPWLRIHPLSLITCEGNGRGGGDFRGEDSRIGLWARNHISIEKEVPEGYVLGDEDDVQFYED